MPPVTVIYDPAKQRVPIKAWLDDLEAGALEQALHLAQLPFAHKHVALMPDAHQGYGMPVGGVLAAKGYVIPNAVGVDIGCGMQARRTGVKARSLAARDREHGTLLKAVLGDLMRDVPNGNGPAGSHRAPQQWDFLGANPEFAALVGHAPDSLRKAWAHGAYQLGTLGGGNHFLEIQEDEDGFVWVMLHSGSRALGKAVCDHFNALARDINARFHSEVPREWQLAYLSLDSDEGRDYVAWMRLCLRYAEENRARMLQAALTRLLERVRDNQPDRELEISESVDTHHNYATLEEHFGEEVLVHRKGSVRARAGEMVVIPGSMETGSYVARGVGSAESFQTCGHGAGRRLSRGAALRARTAESVLSSLRQKGIELAKRSHKDVAEEAGHAYKDVDQVMAFQRDLVEPVYKLKPLGVVKG
ncbi:MAG TPA: RtcB family protein [Chloroflexota bacterium]|nr:RtcB family protein [Chloroflexota bacterium]